MPLQLLQALTLTRSSSTKVCRIAASRSISGDLGRDEDLLKFHRPGDSGDRPQGHRHHGQEASVTHRKTPPWKGQLIYTSTGNPIKGRNLLPRKLLRSELSPPPKSSPGIAGDGSFKVLPVALQFLAGSVPSVQGDQGDSDVPEAVTLEPVSPPLLAKPSISKGARGEDGFVFPLDLVTPDSVRRGRRGGRPRTGEARRGQQQDPAHQRTSSAQLADFEVLEEGMEKDEAMSLLESDQMFRFGTADPARAPSKVPCGGCGAHLHCQDRRLPGFVPSELFLADVDSYGGTQTEEDDDEGRLRGLRCLRCYVMEKYDVALKVSTSPSDYPRTVAHLKDKPGAIVLLIVDLLDFPGSVWPDLTRIIGGRDKRIILVGNKVDLLPADSQNYLKRVEKAMRAAFVKKYRRRMNKRVGSDGTGGSGTENDESSDHGGVDGGDRLEVPELIGTILISAKTGYNVEVLIDQVFECWRHNNKRYRGQNGQAGIGGDIYLLGTTNVGKSSLFNRLIESDLCKGAAAGKVDLASTSRVPGTTLNLLKFPVSRPEPSRMALRSRRLERQRVRVVELDMARVDRIQSSGKKSFGFVPSSSASSDDLQYFLIPSENVEKTAFGHGRNRKAAMQDLNYSSEETVADNFQWSGGFVMDMKEDHKQNQGAGKGAGNLSALDPRDPEFADGRWCYDTPGSVSPDQIINLLTQEEIMLTLADKPLVPRTFLVAAGQSLLIGGLARLDVLEEVNRATDRMLLTLFSNSKLPVNIVKTEDADDFRQQHLGDPTVMGVPRGGPERLRTFPELRYRKLRVDGIGTGESACDVVLSSAGWVACTTKVATVFDIKAWTPGGRGIFVRDPPFLPEAVKLRGQIISRTPAFQNNRIFVPYPAKLN